MHIPEPVLVQTGILEAGIEALYKDVLSGLAGLDKVQLYPGLFDQKNMTLDTITGWRRGQL